MHRLGIEPRSTGWKPVILPLNYRCSRGIYIICVLNISTPEKGFEPLTSSLGGKRSIQAELPGHKLSRINRFKNYAGEIKFFGIFNLPYLMREKGFGVGYEILAAFKQVEHKPTVRIFYARKRIRTFDLFLRREALYPG